jgi:hypothetical protein
LATTPRTMERPNPSLLSATARNGDQQKAIRRRCDRITFGFWLGAVILGTVGCILGASMSYPHPVARVISVLWWGIYLACLGASIGALVGVFTKWALTRPSWRTDGPEKAANESELDSGAAMPGQTLCAQCGRRRSGDPVTAPPEVVGSLQGGEIWCLTRA